MQFIKVLVMLCITNNIYCQNLIPNSYFNEISFCPPNYFDFFVVKNWFILNSSPDIFNECVEDTPDMYGGIPQNMYGFQFPKKGTGYIGLGPYSYNDEQDSNRMITREYVGVKLNSPLEVANTYCIYFYASLSDGVSWWISTLGVKFYDTLYPNVQIGDTFFFNGDFSQDISANYPLTSTTEWMKISGSIIGNGQKYMAVGNWQINSLSGMTPNYNGGGFSYYYLDDFHLYEVKPAEYDVLLPEPCEENEEATLTARYYEELRWFVMPDTINAVGTDSVFTVSLTQDTIQVLLYSRLCEYEFTDTITLIKPVCPPIPEPEILEPEIPEPVISIPNIITPNGDGVNDVFFIENLPEGSELFIYNRWGNLIYEATQYNNQWQPNIETSDGVYYYLLKLPNGESWTGFFTVVR
jgi:gliding motility-associated-like protein